MELKEERESSIIVRAAKREDCAAIMELKQELAVHQDMGDLPRLSVQELQRDGFDVNPPCFQCLVAEIPSSEDSSGKAVDQGRLVGYALYFFAYAAWEGKTLHLEDLCVSKSVRGSGIGSKMLKELAKIAVAENCARIQLEVLDSNVSGLKFYDSYGGWDTTAAEGWHNFRLDKAAIDRLLQ